MKTSIKVPKTTKVKKSVLASIKSKALKPEDLNVVVNYLVHNFIVEQSLIMLYAKGGQGKSFFTLALAVQLIKTGNIKECIYLDMDNSIAALKARGLDKILEDTKELSYIHQSKLDNSAQSYLDEILDSVSQSEVELPLESVLIVVDSIRDFLGGRDMNSDKDIRPLMEKMKTLRDRGATVIFLHHTTKEGDGDQYKGSTSFRDSVDLAFSLSSVKKGEKLMYGLRVDKDRIPVESCAFELDTRSMELVSENFELNQMNENEANFIKQTTALLSTNQSGINQSKLLVSLGTYKDNKTAIKYLQKYNGKFWESRKEPKANNATLYFPLDGENEAAA